MAQKNDHPPGANADSEPLPDTGAYKAMAHPDRLRMLGILRFDGPSTATALAKRLGLNSGATSYHLRQLALHGLIEEAEDLGNKRDRWWQARRVADEEDPAESTGGAPQAVVDMVAGVFRQHQAMMQRGLNEFSSLPDEWKKTANVSDYTMALTAEEALAFKEKLLAMLWDAVRQSPSEGDALSLGERNYTIMLHAFPFDGAPGTKDDGSKPND